MIVITNMPYSEESNPYEVELTRGKYLIELWGAEGGTWDSENYSGRGAYTRGLLDIRKRTKLYVYIGEKGSTITGKEGTAPATFNGGGYGKLVATGGVLTHIGSSGGGATDVRTKRGSSWDEEESLLSRIMVAAGGGGSTRENVNNLLCKGGYGGGEKGEDGEATGNGNNIKKATGGSQNNTGSKGGVGLYCSGSDGKLGKAGNGGNCYSTSGGGGGYYGGGGSGVSSYNHQCGAGGSSYISGLHPTDIKELTFRSASMIAGNKEIKEPSGITKIGHIGNGFARISKQSVCSQRQSMKSVKLITTLIIFISQ